MLYSFLRQGSFCSIRFQFIFRSLETESYSGVDCMLLLFLIFFLKSARFCALFANPTFFVPWVIPMRHPCGRGPLFLPSKSRDGGVGMKPRRGAFPPILFSRGGDFDQPQPDRAVRPFSSLYLAAGPPYTQSVDSPAPGYGMASPPPPPSLFWRAVGRLEKGSSRPCLWDVPREKRGRRRKRDFCSRPFPFPRFSPFLLPLPRLWMGKKRRGETFQREKERKSPSFSHPPLPAFPLLLPWLVTLVLCGGGKGGRGGDRTERQKEGGRLLCDVFTRE